MAYPTGRTRGHTFEISGTIPCRQEYFGDVGDYYGRVSGGAITFGFLSDLLRINVFNEPSINAFVWGVKIYEGISEEVSEIDSEALGGASYDESRSFTFSGTVTIPDVEERFEVLGLDAVLTDTINLLEWVSFGGTPSDDYLPPLKIRFYEVILEDAEIEITASINGTSGTHTYIVPGDTEVSYAVSIGSRNFASAEFGDVGAICTHTMEWECELNGESIFPSDAWTTTPDSQGAYSNKQESFAKCELGTLGSGFSEASSSLLVQPSTLFTVIGSLYAQDQPYPGTIDFDLWGKKTLVAFVWVPTPTTHTLNPTASVSVEQKSFTFAGGTNLTSHTPLAKDETMGVRANLKATDLAAKGEATADWRLMFRGYRWKCGTLTHADLTIDDGSSSAGWSGGANTTHSNTSGAQVAVVSGGSGSLTKAPASDVNCEGHRYLAIRIKATGAAQPFKIRLVHADGEEKEYSGVTGAADTYFDVRIDLCLPDGHPDEVDEQESRWPLNEFGGTPTNSGQNWGFNQFDALHIENLADGQTYSIDSIKLTKGEFSQITFLPAFRPWLEAWTSETDTTYQKPAAWTNSNGRISDRCFLFKVDAEGPGVTYSWYDIDDSLGQIAGQSGWTVGASVTPTDGYHGNGLPGFLIEPFIYDYGDPGEWTLCYDRDAQSAADIFAQALWDEVEIYPGAGQVWTGGAYDEPTQIAFAKSLRGQAWGLVYDEIDEAPESGQVVTLKTDTGMVAAGSGTSDAQGHYETGTPFAKSAAHKAYCADLSTTAFTAYNRMRHRRCFSVPPEIAKWIWNLITRIGFFYRAQAVGSGIRIRRSNIPRPSDPWAEDTVIGESEDRRPTLFEETALNRVHVVFERNGDVLGATSLDDGRTWSEPISIMAGYYPTSNGSPNGWRIYASLLFDSGTSGPGKISLRRKGPGQSDPDAAIDAVDETEDPIKVEEGTFHIFSAGDAIGSWLLSAVPEGETDPAEWISMDDGLTWKRL